MMNSKKDLATKSNVDLNAHGLESDGLPFIGKLMEQGDSEMVVYDKTLDKAKFTKFKDNECARIENIRLMSYQNYLSLLRLWAMSKEVCYSLLVS